MLTHSPFHKGVNSRRTQLQQVLDVFDPNVNFTRGRILGTCHLGEKKNDCGRPYSSYNSKMTGFHSRDLREQQHNFSAYSLPCEPCTPGCHSTAATPPHSQGTPDTTCWCCFETGEEKELLGKPSLPPAPQKEGLCVATTTSQHPTVPPVLITADELEVVEPFLSPNKSRCENQM